MGDLVRIYGKLITGWYLQILRQNAAPSRQRPIGKPFILQRDNDPKHAIQMVKKYSKNLMPRFKYRWYYRKITQQSCIGEWNPIPWLFAIAASAITRKTKRNSKMSERGINSTSPFYFGTWQIDRNARNSCATKHEISPSGSVRVNR